MHTQSREKNTQQFQQVCLLFYLFSASCLPRRLATTRCQVMPLPRPKSDEVIPKPPTGGINRHETLPRSISTPQTPFRWLDGIMQHVKSNPKPLKNNPEYDSSAKLALMASLYLDVEMVRKQETAAGGNHSRAGAEHLAHSSR